ncbi:C39 family peptidase [bacterium]|nr:C39 family peptidase [bacterium]NUN46537.1 C39 family peptidase [bacterium]
MNINKRILIGLGTVVLMVFGVMLYPRFAEYRLRTQLEKENEAALKEISKTDIIHAAAVADTMPVSFPEKAYLEVPFYCQAPHMNSDSWKIHKESCEEAAVLQAVFYNKGIKNVSVDSVDWLIKDMLRWQDQHFGGHKDIHADSVKMMMMGYFGYKDEEVKILRKAKIEDIKRYVAMGYPVIAPTFGRTLKNPFYTPPGPRYHMLTVIGYTPDRVITNDVGTRRGKDFTYPYDIFQKSMDEEGGDCLVIMSKK